MKETEEYTPTEEIVVNFLRAVAERKNEVDLGNKLLHKRYHGWKNPGCCLERVLLIFLLVCNIHM